MKHSHNEPDFAATLTDYWIHESVVQPIPGFMPMMISVGGFHSKQCPANWFIFFFPFWQASCLRPTQWAYSTQFLHKQKCVDSSIFRFFHIFFSFVLVTSLSLSLLVVFFFFFPPPLKSFQNVCFIFPQFLYQFFCGFSQQVSTLYGVRVIIEKHAVIFALVTYSHRSFK